MIFRLNTESTQIFPFLIVERPAKDNLGPAHLAFSRQTRAMATARNWRRDWDTLRRNRRARSFQYNGIGIDNWFVRHKKLLHPCFFPRMVCLFTESIIHPAGGIIEFHFDRHIATAT